MKVQIAPWLPVVDATAAVAFYQKAFGAEIVERVDDHAGGVMIAELAVGGATFWVQADEHATAGSPRMILIVDDPDAAYARAVAAGGTVVAEVHDGHGWRTGRIADPAGLHWEFARRLHSATS